MPDGNDDARVDCLLDERQRTFPFGSQREDPDPTAGGLLVAAELIPVRIPDVLSGMGPPRSVFRRDRGPLDVESDE